MTEKWSIGDGKNNAEWCVFKGSVCVASCSTEHGIFISEAQNIATKMNEIDSLRQQLAECQAALLVKDGLIQEAIDQKQNKSIWKAPYEAHEWISRATEVITGCLYEALSIKPGTEALEKWLGDPVFIQSDHLQKARVAPFLCRVEPIMREGGFEPLYTKPKGIS